MPVVKVFKFGGASIRNAEMMLNVASILQNFKNQPIVLIVSALGKSTNALEAVFEADKRDKKKAHELLDTVYLQHTDIASKIVSDAEHPVFAQLKVLFDDTHHFIDTDASTIFDYRYDRIVSVGELASTNILAALLNNDGLPTLWLDVRRYVRTDNTYREGVVNWDLTRKQIKPLHELVKGGFILTQGFIGQSQEGHTITLGREGSDYTASIFAYCLDAESVTIWKDVPGVLSADPRYFDNAQLIKHLSYREAIEMTYYGATVIHPKTIKPLENKNIPLYVRSFIDATVAGTVIDNNEPTNLPPIRVKKGKQLLMSISTNDFSFITEDNISQVFYLFAKYNIAAHLMQTSAITCSFCIDDVPEKTDLLLKSLSYNFKVHTNNQVELITVRHYSQEALATIMAGRPALLEQMTRTTAQVVVKEV